MPPPLPPVGFWSYSREDDRRSGGKLSQLRQLLTQELEGLFGRAAGVRLHQDLSMIKYGNLWETKIQEALAECSFMIAVLTPDFFQSKWCCKEVELFQNRERALGRSGLIFPIEYISVGRMSRADAFDPNVWDRMQRTQMVKFSDWRHHPPDTTLEVTRLLAGLAEMIADELSVAVDAPPPEEEPEPKPKTLVTELAPTAEKAPEPLPLPAIVPPEALPEPETAAPTKIADEHRPATIPGPPPAPKSGFSWRAGGIAIMVALILAGVGWKLPDLIKSPAPATAPQQPTPPPPPPEPPHELHECANCPEMVLIPAGKFMRGVDDAEEEREEVPKEFRQRAQPVKEVTIGKPFYLAKYTVTVGEFRAFVKAKGVRAKGCWGYEKGANGTWSLSYNADRDWEHPGFQQTERDPVVCVNPQDADDYAAWLRETTHKDYRLPSETEWEYAARAARPGMTPVARYWGNGRDEACQHANVAGATLAKQWGIDRPDPKRFFACAEKLPFTAPVGSFPPNGFGLHDMLGNVWQWTADVWHDDYNGAPLDGSVWTTGGSAGLRVLRGGSWINNPWFVRSGARDGNSVRFSFIGFRLARTL